MSGGTFEITTQHLILRSIDPMDAPRIQSFLQEKEIAANARSIPYPYPPGTAEQWIENQLRAISNGEACVIAITRKSDALLSDSDRCRPLIGVAGLAIDNEHHHAELGYWVGKPYWGKGVCTEAAGALIRYGFEQIGLHRIHAHYLARNPASGRVLEKIGMTREGLFRQHVRKWGCFEDVVFYGMLASDQNA
ncbi:MAG: GNAT family N-acetyltransferase [Planctomycetota bacterium]